MRAEIPENSSHLSIILFFSFFVLLSEISLLNLIQHINLLDKIVGFKLNSMFNRLNIKNWKRQTAEMISNANQIEARWKVCNFVASFVSFFRFFLYWIQEKWKLPLAAGKDELFIHRKSHQNQFPSPQTIVNLIWISAVWDFPQFLFFSHFWWKKFFSRRSGRDFDSNT